MFYRELRLHRRLHGAETILGSCWMTDHAHCISSYGLERFSLPGVPVVG
jgi:hypothetical protein